MTVGRGKNFEEKETKAILEVLQKTEFTMHRRGRYKRFRWYGQEKMKNAFGEDLLTYITQMTYPYGDPIITCWSHLVDSKRLQPILAIALGVVAIIQILSNYGQLVSWLIRVTI